MPRFRQTAEILKLMNRKERIRNVGVIAHIDHGKTTMTDSLLIGAGLLPPQVAGSARVLDYLEEEQKRGITIKTANISLLHEIKGDSYVINLVDTPGHVDFTGKVARALRAIDGAIVVVDAVEEVMAQTETVTQQALEERVKPVLFINKIDRLISELKLTAEEIQKKLAHIIADFNTLIEIYGEPQFRVKWKVNPEKESVAFGSALHKWGFTLGLIKQKGMKFTDIIDAHQKGNGEQLSEIAPLSKAILEMTVKNIPNPVDAQKYRIPKIWRGKLNSDIGRAMLACDDNGPTAMCITNVQADAKSGLTATGRLFSGRIEEGMHVYLVGNEKEGAVDRVSMYMGAFQEIVSRITAGNIAALAGLESVRAGETLVDATHKADMVRFEQVRYVSEPILTVGVEPKKPSDLSRLLEAMNMLSTEDPNLTIIVNKETGEYLLSGMGELHLEIALKLLAQHSGIELASTSQTVSHRESILKKGATVMTRSPNKCNALWVQVEPLEATVLDLMEKGELEEETENKHAISILENKAKYPKDQATSVWAFDKNRNMLMNSTRNVQNLKEAKGSIVSGFHWTCRTGPLCEEPLRGVKVKLTDAQLHENPEQREASQIMRVTSRAILGSFLTAEPILLEPIYKIEVSIPTPWFGACSKILARRHGKIENTEQSGALTKITGYIPVEETLGLSAELRSATSGRAFWQCTFDHWQKLPENQATGIIRKIRKRRGLPPEIPKPDKFVEET
jgi:elongation factor 2